ncbi:OmpA family protein [Nocardiopsis valliformis]|uniref:OmpA family protein n=1 Tax=Nocardiopsis valliformis TaxID=239974 RepID=UPI001EFA050B|nr:OmpA family protein [Nocardiopsis valliformis]
MTPNTRPPRRSTSWAVTAIAALLLSSGCVVGSEEPPEDLVDDNLAPDPPEGSTQKPEGNDEEIIASSISTSTGIGSDLQIDIYALERIEEEFLRLRMGVTNKSGASFDLGYGLARLNSPLSASEVSLIDEVEHQRYLSYSLNDGSCFCSALDGTIASGASKELWVIYPAPPEGLDAMTVITPLTPPMMNIPISDSSESIESVDLADREILDLISISDDTDTQTGRTEGGEEVSIILSSDVLFDTNSSELNSEAREILEQVAQEIDDASALNISIDGHADNTGNDSINIPLSQDRAESVESALGDLITREGISFDSEGHGSADPIASNDTEEGRERNRRVTVTFEK